MTTKEPSYKQIIVPMGNDNAKNIMNTSSMLLISTKLLGVLNQT